MSVDLGTPEGLPQTGVFTSDQGEILIADKVIVKVQSGSIRLGNSVSVYRETGNRFGTTYAGIQRVTGTITKAFINLAEIRLALGAEPGKSVGPAGNRQTYFAGPGILSVDTIAAMLEDHTHDYPNRPNLRSPYPALVDIAMSVNIDRMAATPANSDEGATVNPGIQRVIAKRCMLNTFALNFNGSGLITNGPIAFQGGSVEWDLYVPTES